MSVLIFAVTLLVALVMTAKYNGAVEHADNMEKVIRDIMNTHGIMSHRYEDDDFICNIYTHED